MMRGEPEGWSASGARRGDGEEGASAVGDTIAVVTGDAATLVSAGFVDVVDGDGILCADISPSSYSNVVVSVDVTPCDVICRSEMDVTELVRRLTSGDVCVDVMAGSIGVWLASSKGTVAI